MLYVDAKLCCANGHGVFSAVGVGEEDGYLVGEDLKICDECGLPLEVLTVEKLKDPDDILIITDNALENANYHSLNAGECYSQIIGNLKKRNLKINKKIKTAIALGLYDYFSNL